MSRQACVLVLLSAVTILVAWAFSVSGSAVGQQGVPYPIVLNVEYLPHPRDMVRVQEGQPFTVPSGRIFVVTGLGCNNSGVPNVVLFFDSGTGPLRVLDVDPTSSDGNGATSVKPVPSGLTASVGAIVSVTGGGSGDDAVVLGYLADE